MSNQSNISPLFAEDAAAEDAAAQAKQKPAAKISPLFAEAATEAKQQQQKQQQPTPPLSSSSSSSSSYFSSLSSSSSSSSPVAVPWDEIVEFLEESELARYMHVARMHSTLKVDYRSGVGGQ